MWKKLMLVSMIASTTLTGCTTTSLTSKGDPAMQRSEIDAGIDGALDRMYSQVKGSRELASKAEGILVFPRVIAAGLVVGGEYGKGGLRAGNVHTGYYSMTSMSVGLQAGAQSKAVVILFMTRDALNKFQNSRGWTAGVDASVALLKIGANGEIDTSTATQPVQAMVLTNAGLMANLSIEGTKISSISL